VGGVKPISIGEGTWLGLHSVILPGTHIGKNCVVGANAVVKGIFPDYCVIAGVPAKIVKQYDLDSERWVHYK
jgi:acetyltransferase-like isoleucine patch superfamily enzyme